ncbi:hypothetical protein HOC80_01175 [archaeon]|jgi:hypothetical protein|nr:hypothetical protein [archaeon]MBT4416695.1 hypothetical protein [archaeon]
MRDQERLADMINFTRKGVDIAVCFNDSEMDELDQSVIERSDELLERYPQSRLLSPEERIAYGEALTPVRKDLQKSSLIYASHCMRIRNHFAEFLRERDIERFGFTAKVDPDRKYDAILTCPVRALASKYVTEARKEFPNYTIVVTLDPEQNPLRREGVVLV